MTIKLPINFCAGVCHWCCMYHDLEVAEKMFQTKNVQINRFDNEKKTGSFKLIIQDRNRERIPMLKFVIWCEFALWFKFTNFTRIRYFSYEILYLRFYQNTCWKWRRYKRLSFKRGDRKPIGIFENSLDLSD